MLSRPRVCWAADVAKVSLITARVPAVMVGDLVANMANCAALERGDLGAAVRGRPPCDGVLGAQVRVWQATEVIMRDRWVTVSRACWRWHCAGKVAGWVGAGGWVWRRAVIARRHRSELSPLELRPAGRCLLKNLDIFSPR